MRYIAEEDADQPLAVRRLSTLQVDGLAIVDLHSAQALSRLGLSRAQLTSGFGSEIEVEVCREIGDVVRFRDDVHGMLVPSAAMPIASTLVVFPSGLDCVTVIDSKLMRLVVSEEQARERD